MMQCNRKSVFVSIPTEERAERLKFEGVLSYAHDKTGCKWHLQTDPGGLLPHILTNFNRFNFDGIIAYVTNPRIRTDLARIRCPTVLIEDQQIPSTPLSRNGKITLICDHVIEGERAARYFLDRHHTEFAWVGPTHAAKWSDERKSGFIAELKKRGMRCHCYQRPTGEAKDNFAVELPILVHWLKELPRPCAVFVCRDARARQVITAATEVGIPIPEGLSILGVDDDEIICTTTEPALSSITTSDHSIGYTAGRALNELILGRSTGGIIRARHPQVTTRMSTDAEAVPDAYVQRALQYVRQHLSEKFDAKDLAAHVCIPTQALQAKCEKALGITLGKEIQRIRINAAASLLSGTQKSVGQIAEECGFVCTSYLSLKMKEYFNATPLQYRKSHQI